MKSHKRLLKSQEQGSRCFSSHQKRSTIHLIPDPPSAWQKILKANAAWWISPLWTTAALFCISWWFAAPHGLKTYLKSQFWISRQEGIRSAVLTGGSRRRHTTSEREAKNQDGIWFSLAIDLRCILSRPTPVYLQLSYWVITVKQMPYIWALLLTSVWDIVAWLNWY